MTLQGILYFHLGYREDSDDLEIGIPQLVLQGLHILLEPPKDVLLTVNQGIGGRVYGAYQINRIACIDLLSN